MQCGVCGGSSFTSRRIIWDQLANDWQLSSEERAYIDRQQAETCDQCGSNLRSIALANALRAFMGSRAPLCELAASEAARQMRILEINEAGNLTPVLKSFGGYTFGAYPEVDMHALPFADGSFDVVIHSDTLEHIPNPVHALSECRRVLKPEGALCFTVPMVVGRLSRSRQGLPLSFHGNSATMAEDWAVQTEFGADAWTYVMAAGFTEVSLHSIGYPAGIAMLARRGG